MAEGTSTGRVAPGESRTADIGGAGPLRRLRRSRRRPGGRARPRARWLAPQLGPLRPAADAARARVGHRPARFRPQRARRPEDERPGERRGPPAVPGRRRRRAGRPRRQLDGRDDLAAHRRRAARRGHRPRPARPGGARSAAALDPLVAVTFALYALPFVGSASSGGAARGSPPSRGCARCSRCAGSTPTTCRAEVIDRSVTLLEERQDVEGMDRAFLAAARSLVKLLVDPRRYRSAMADLGRRCCSSTGSAPAGPGRRRPRHRPAAPKWRYVELPGVGHVPQLQVPERVAAEILDWMRTEVAPKANA